MPNATPFYVLICIAFMALFCSTNGAHSIESDDVYPANVLEPKTGLGIKGSIHGNGCVCRNDIKSYFAHSMEETIKRAIIIDSGSTGTRIHCYCLIYINRSVHSLQSDVFEEIHKPLSDFVGNRNGMKTEIFDHLLAVARKAIPTEYHCSTHVSFKATAGFRTLSEESRNDLLANIRSILQEDWPFPPEGHDFETAVSIIDGETEGKWAWVALNFLQGKIGNNTARGLPHREEIGTIGMIDLGGASVQIVLEITESEAQSVPSEFQESLIFHGKPYHLFRNSHLLFGLEMAKTIFLNTSDQQVIGSCISPAANNSKDNNYGEGRHNLLAHRIDVAKCYDKIKDFIEQSGSFSTYSNFSSPTGVPPSLSRNPYRSSKIAALLSVQARVHPFAYETENHGEMFELGLDELFERLFRHCDISSIASKRREFVSSPSLSLTNDSPQPPSSPLGRKLQQNPHLCLEVLYIYSQLVDGFKIPASSDVKVIFLDSINGFSVGWPLGAALEMTGTPLNFVKNKI